MEIGVSFTQGESESQSQFDNRIIWLILRANSADEIDAIIEKVMLTRPSIRIRHKLKDLGNESQAIKDWLNDNNLIFHKNMI